MRILALLTTLGQGAVYAVITFAFIIVAKQIADRRTTTIDDDHEIQENSNSAVGFRRTGLYLAYAIAFAGTLSGVSAGFATDVVALLVDGVVITLCLFASRTINDRVMMAHIDNDAQVLSGNTAVGLTELGMYIATGCVLNGAFTGTSDNLAGGVASALVFFIVGQAALLVCGYCYELLTPFHIRDEIKKGNAAAGIALAGMLIALGIILRSSIAGPSTGWSADFLSFGVYTLYGIVLLVVFKWVVGRFLLPGAPIAVEVERDRNVAAVLLTESGIVAVALVIGAVM